MKINEAIKIGIEKLVGSSSSVLDCQLLLAHALGVDKSYIIMNPNEEIGDCENFFKLVELRAGLMPIQHIIGKCEFFGLEFGVDENVLIPRADTEILVETVINQGKQKKIRNILEIGTGSGAISVSLAKNMPNAKITAIDISEKALKKAIKNAEINNTEIEFIKADVFKWQPADIFDIIVSNPPYIRTSDIAGLDRNVKDYEPHSALDGGADGLEFYRRIAELDAKYFALEVGFDQAEEVGNIFRKSFSSAKIERIKDINKIDRVIFIDNNK